MSRVRWSNRGRPRRDGEENPEAGSWATQQWEHRARFAFFREACLTLRVEAVPTSQVAFDRNEPTLQIFDVMLTLPVLQYILACNPGPAPAAGRGQPRQGAPV